MESAPQGSVLALVFPPPFLEFEKARKLAEACLRLTPKIALRPLVSGKTSGRNPELVEALYLHLTKNPKSTVPRLQLLLKRFHEESKKKFAISNPIPAEKPRWGWGETAAEALVRARFPSNIGRENFPLEALTEWLHPFEKNPEKNRELLPLLHALPKLGIKTLEDFRRIPPGALASRFGKQAVHLALRIRKQEEENQKEHLSPWPLFIPEEKFIEKMDLFLAEDMAGCSNLQGIDFVLRPLLDRLTARLRGRGQRASRLRLTLHAKPVRTLNLELPTPQGSTGGIFPILRESLQWEVQKRPLEAPVDALSLEVLETAPGRGAQTAFFQKHVEESENWDSLVGRLAQKLGKKNAFLAKPVECYLPEKAWSRHFPEALPIPSNASSSRTAFPDGFLGPRPSRLLSRPLPLFRIENILIARIVNPSGRNCERRWKILELIGPERLSGNWWDPSSAFSRDYYRVRTANNETLWVFDTTGNLFLHGFFD